MMKAHMEEIPKEKVSLALDLLGCCCFMLKDYNAANDYFSQAILQNPKMIEFQINKATALRKLGL